MRTRFIQTWDKRVFINIEHIVAFEHRGSEHNPNEHTVVAVMNHLMPEVLFEGTEKECRKILVEYVNRIHAEDRVFQRITGGTYAP